MPNDTDMPNESAERMTKLASANGDDHEPHSGGYVYLHPSSSATITEKWVRLYPMTTAPADRSQISHSEPLTLDTGPQGLGDIASWLRGHLDHDAAVADNLEHYNPDGGGIYSCPATRTSPLGSLPYGPKNCDCGVGDQRYRAKLAIAAHHRILEQHELVARFTKLGRWDKIFSVWRGAEVEVACRTCQQKVARVAGGCDTVRILALAYQDRAGYLDTWRI